jgi:heme oxygenase (biliverdin-producing, ferredoxin)
MDTAGTHHGQDREPAEEPLSPAGTTLSKQLRTHTRAIHRRAERTGVIRAIATGAVTRHTYGCYLHGLYPVYSALESRLARDPRIAASGVLSSPGLHRAPALRRDLEALVGPNWDSALPEVAASARYRADVANSGLAELVAHAYVRYLADLNGGAILAGALRRHLGLDEAELSFHAFPALGDTVRFIERFRATVDTLVSQRDYQVALIAAERAFQLNIALAEEVMRT